MDDLISRKAAIDALGKDPGFKVKLFGKSYDEGRSDQWFKDVHVLTALPSAQPEQRWIPSSERPPEEGSYLVWMPFAPPEERIAVEYYCDGYWNIKTPISAWMPLPEPYRGGGA